MFQVFIDALGRLGQSSVKNLMQFSFRSPPTHSFFLPFLGLLYQPLCLPLTGHAPNYPHHTSSPCHALAFCAQPLYPPLINRVHPPTPLINHIAHLSPAIFPTSLSTRPVCPQRSSSSSASAQVDAFGVCFRQGIVCPLVFHCLCLFSRVPVSLCSFTTCSCPGDSCCMSKLKTCTYHWNVYFGRQK